jgi:hypothetical protein
MGVAGPEDGAMPVSKAHQGVCQRQGSGVDVEQLVFEIQPQIAGHLIVAGPAGVEPLTSAGSAAGQPVLDRCVDILVAMIQSQCPT